MDSTTSAAASAACADHCPFVNRRDARCSAHLSIDGLGHAFDFCFDQYTRCPVYFDQLMERRARRTQEAIRNAASGAMSFNDQAAVHTVHDAKAAPADRARLVEVTVYRRVLNAVSGRAGVAGAAAHANAR